MDWRIDPEEQARRDALAMALGGNPAGPARGSKVNAHLRERIGNPEPPGGYSPQEQRAHAYVEAGGKPAVNSRGVSMGVVPQAVLDGDGGLSPDEQKIRKAMAAGVSEEVARATLAKMKSEAAAAQAAQDKKDYDPTTGMSTFEKVAAGAGGRMHELYQGAKQLLGVGDQAAIDEQKKLDAPLKDTGAGMAGGIITDIATLALPGGAAVRGAGKLLPAAAKAYGKVPKYLTVPTAGAAAGAAQSAIEPVASDETQEEKTLAGAAGGALGNIAGRVLGRVITPFRSTSPSRQNLVKALEKEDIPTSSAQATGSDTLTAIETAMKSIPGLQGAMTAGSETQKHSFTKALSKHLGEDTDALTPEVMDAASKRIGQVFEQVGNAQPKPLSATYKQAVQNIRAEATADARQAGRPHPYGRAELDQADARIADPIDLTGSGYNKTRSDLTADINKLYKSTESGSTQKAEILEKLRDALDSEAQTLWNNPTVQPGRSALTSTTFNAPARGLKEAWSQWHILKDLQRPGVIDLEGAVDPTKLHSVVNRNTQGSLAARTGTEYQQLARAAGVLKSGGKDSGTARNLLIARALANPLTAGAAGVYAWNSPEEAVTGGASLAAALLAANSKMGKKYFTNSMMNKHPALLQALRSGGTVTGAGLAMGQEE